MKIRLFTLGANKNANIKTSTKTTNKGAYDKFSDFYRTGTFIDSTHNETIFPYEVISSGCNALVVPFPQLLERPHGSPLVWLYQ